jgi:hypothetical protein
LIVSGAEAIRCCLVFTLFLAGVATDYSCSYSGPGTSVPPEYFGLHVHRAGDGTPWPIVTFASWRLWDSGVAWPQLEPERGKWDFKLLDRYVGLAAEHDIDIVLTLGLTPSWASARPEEPSAYKPGNAAEPTNINDWTNYVRTVAQRYKGVIRTYEIWNEPNVKGTFTGTPASMLQLSRAAYEALKSIDRSISVISPSATANAGVDWLSTFLQDGGCQYSDVIGYHFYVTPDPPEATIALIRQVKGVLKSKRCADKPLWNTEFGWAAPKHFSSDSEAAGYLMRAYIVAWLMGVDRSYWYAWDNHNWSTLETTTRNGGEATSVGKAYGVIRDWILGSVLNSCSLQVPDVWVCRLERGATRSWIMWSPGRTLSFTVPQVWGVKRMSDWTGHRSVPTTTLELGPAPLYLSDSIQ